MAEVIETIWRSDVKEAERFFEYAGYQARNMGEPLRKAGAAFIEHIRETFLTEGYHAEQYWEDVSPDWRRHKDAHPGLGSDFLLRYDDDLFDTATDPDATLRPSIADNEIVYELDDPLYAHIHQEGAEWVSKKGKPSRIPARPFVVVTDEFSEQVEQIFADWLDDLHDANQRRMRISKGLNPLR